MSQIKKKFLKDAAVDGSKILFLNDQALKSRNAADTADVSLMKLDSADKLKFLTLPQVSSDPVSGDDLVRKSHVDSEISAVTGDLSTLEGRVDDLEESLGEPLGIATLDENGLVPTSQLPSYVDDVLEFASLAAFPNPGQTGKIYIALDTNKTYRWGGSVYVQITSGAVDSVNGQTGIVVLDSEDVAESGDSRYYTAARQTAIEGYADQAELDAIAAAEAYTDAEIAALLVPEGQRKHVNYVSGSDVTGNGSQLKPWKTVSYACSQITDSAPVVTTATWAAGSNVLAVASTAGLAVGQLIVHSSGSSVGFATGTAIVTAILSGTSIQISVTTTAARTTAFSLTFRKLYCIEFDGQGLYDTVTLPPYVMIVGKNMSSSQIGTVNLTLPAVAVTGNTVMNAQINVFNLDSTAVTTGHSTRFFDCSFNDLNCVGKASGSHQVLLYSSDVLNQLHWKGGYLQIAAPNYLQRVRVFHTSNGGSTNYVLIQGGQHASSAGTWLSGNASLQVIGGVSMNVPVVTWGEESAGVFRGRAFPFVATTNAWSTDVTISIQNAATEVILTGNGTKTISTLISEWNAANPTNLMTLTQGNGAQIPATGTEIVFRSGAKPAIIFDSSSYVTESASLQGPVSVVPNARPEGIRYDDRARASYYGFRFYAQTYGVAGNSISLAFTGSNTVAQAVTSWNTANPSNQVSYTSAGSADARGYDVILPAATVALSGGGLFVGSSVTFTVHDAIRATAQKAKDLEAADVVTQGLIDALEAASVEFVQQKFVLSSGDIAAGYIDLSQLAIGASVNAFVDRLAIHETDDYVLSTVGGVTRMTFAGSLIGGGDEQLVAGDVIRVKYAKRAIA